jgi:TetR/AcrR family transcriptional regulator, transcriptional repressor for nem operon
MRYKPEHKERSRSKIVGASGAKAKRLGFGASGIDEMAKAAGVTSGAVYKHFAGKDALLSAIIANELETTTSRFAMIDAENILLAIDGYLSLTHVEHPERGCVLPSLAPEVARASNDTRTVYEEKLSELMSTLETKVGDRARAASLLSLCVGAVTVARALASDEARKEILRSARASARRLLEGPG